MVCSKLWVSEILEVYLTNLKLMLHVHFFQSQSLGFCHLLNPPGGRGEGGKEKIRELKYEGYIEIIESGHDLIHLVM